jgi:hypothetical protein
LLDNEKKPDLEEVTRGMKMLVQALLKHLKALSEPVQRLKEASSLDTAERLEYLERELLHFKKVKQRI